MRVNDWTKTKRHEVLSELILRGNANSGEIDDALALKPGAASSTLSLAEQAGVVTRKKVPGHGIVYSAKKGMTVEKMCRVMHELRSERYRKKGEYEKRKKKANGKREPCHVDEHKFHISLTLPSGKPVVIDLQDARYLRDVLIEALQ